MVKSQAKQQRILNKNGDRRGMSPNSQKNILPHINRNGRPTKDKSITALIRDMLDQEAGFIAPGASPDDKTWGQLIAKAILYNAAKGNPQMIKELLDRIEGKVLQPVETSGILEIRDTRELTDEELAVIAATDIIKDNALRCSRGASEEAQSP